MPVEPSDNTKAGGGGKKGVDGVSNPALPYADRTTPAGAPSITSSKSVFRRLLGLLRPWRGTILVCILMLLVGGVCEIFPAFVWKYVADDVATKRPSSPMVAWMASFGGRVVNPYALVFWAVVWLLVVYIVGEVLTTVQNNVLSRITQKFIFNLRTQVYQKLQNQSLGYLQRQRTGDLISRATTDVEELQSFINNGIEVILGEGVIWIVTVCVVMYYDWRVASISLAPLILVFFLLRHFNKKIKPVYAAARDRLGDVSTRLSENLSGVVLIKIFGREREESGRFEGAARAYYDEQVRAINARSLYFPFARTVGFLSNVFMIGVGGYFLIKEYDKPGGFTLGTLIMFRAYWWRLFGPVQTLARVNDMVQRAVAAGRRVFEVLDAPDELPDRADANVLARCEGMLELRGVTFAYPVHEGKGQGTRDEGRGKSDVRHALRDVSLRIRPGMTVALCGPSGSGKSTVLNLLLRFYDPQGGVVTVDGEEVRSVTKESLRRHFALVQQESFLFNDSIMDNIRYGHPDATMEQVVAAAKAANAHSFIEALPHGYDTVVGERGVRLSGGQKQRISIARAFLANPQILLLDEPTSSVEPDSEAAIIATLDRLMAGRTTVLTSHRPSLVMQADYVYVLEEGRVTEEGRPEELKDNGGWFARFIRSAESGATVEEGSAP